MSELDAASSGRIVFGGKPAKSDLFLRVILYGGGALIIAAVLLFMKGEGATGFARVGIISFVIFLAVTLEVHALVFRGARGGRGVILDAAGIGGAAVFKAPEHRVAWDRVHEIECDEQAVVVTISPKDMASSNPEDRRSKIRLSVEGTSPAELEAAIRRFWKIGEDA